jgi:hypothetical protein
MQESQVGIRSTYISQIPISHAKTNISTRYFYNAWRPVTAIRRSSPWVASGKNTSDPSWTPLLDPTPNHQDYLSTHATFGGAASAVIRAYNKGELIDVTISSNVAIDNVGVITRRFTNLTAAAVENGYSRVYGGVSLMMVLLGGI